MCKRQFFGNRYPDDLFFQNCLLLPLYDLVIAYLIMPVGTYLYRETKFQDPNGVSPGCRDLGFVQIVGMDVLPILQWTCIIYETKPIQIIRQRCALIKKDV